MRMQEFKVQSRHGVLQIETNFAASARITLRDLRGKSMGSVNVGAGKNTSTLALSSGRARGTYVLEIRTSGRTLARTVPLF
jgi:ribosomal protein L27